ncbi:MAG: aryl-sulfate sulfotransferase, partial [Verrucomicrobia bacterium]|nr:aryl-sulfate sulfotransferase [Verrucomicrobiota bacterium]
TCSMIIPPESLNPGVSNVPGYSNYFAILDNTGNPILLSKTNSLGKLACNGLFVAVEGTKGKDWRWVSKDSSFNRVVTNWAGNGYIADNHDFQVLPNGHALVMIYNSEYLDLSTVVPGGYPAARVDQSILQEVDVDGNVVFQWRSLDHIPVTDTYKPNSKGLDYIHVNSIWFDELDGTIIASCRETSEVIKISRVTGEVVWRMQGKHNQFAFTNAIPGNTDPAYFQEQHSARRLPNGNLTIFDNGYAPTVPGMDRPFTRAVEYVIDEVNKTAALVWQYRHAPDIITSNGGEVQRLSGGHTVITWGPDNTASPKLGMTEVDAAGNLVCDLKLLQNGVTGNFTRMLWPLESTYATVMQRELSGGNTYVFNEGSTNVTGVSMVVDTLNGDIYNTVTVSRQPFAPVLPRFLSKAPRVVPVRVQMSQTAINTMTALLYFDVSSFGLKDPTNTTVYYRETPGQGIFVPLTTEYNWVSHQLQAPVSGFGEYILGFPDLAEVAYAPLLITPKPDAAVNQNLPVSFFWTPKGFAAGYHLQVSTDAGFSTLVADVSDLVECRYTLPSVTGWFK